MSKKLLFLTLKKLFFAHQRSASSILKKLFFNLQKPTFGEARF